MTPASARGRVETLCGVLLAFAFAIALTAALLRLMGAPPASVFYEMLVGSVGSWTKCADVLVVWGPLMLATSGLLLTFRAGLWNIGVEGQIMLGAMGATALLRWAQNADVSPGIALSLAFIAGLAAGLLWATLAGILKIGGGVNEIFSGLGLNFVANALVLWLIFGPWKRPGIGSMSGTEPFPEYLRLPLLPGVRLSPWTLVLSTLAWLAATLLLRRTYFGLRLKAIGVNPRAAQILGIPNARYLLSSLMLCGAFAGLAGAVQVTAVYHRLIPAISSGYGYLGLLTALLAAGHPLAVPFIALFFATVNLGGIQLPIVFRLDSSLSGVLQGLLVLCVLMVRGVQLRLALRRRPNS